MSMNFLLIFPHYISWHYTKAISDLIGLFKNFARFIWTFFSIKLLLQTLFVPFQKLSVKRTKKLDLEDFFSALVTNLLMRIIGFIIRSFFIAIGIFSMIFFVIAYSVLFMIWMVLPLVLLSMFVLGLIAILKVPQV
jgi:hypothetical protein